MRQYVRDLEGEMSLDTNYEVRQEMHLWSLLFLEMVGWSGCAYLRTPRFLYEGRRQEELLDLTTWYLTIKLCENMEMLRQYLEERVRLVELIENYAKFHCQTPS